MAPKDAKPFALPDTLRDLALLRASDVDLSALVSSHEQNSNQSPGSGSNSKLDARADTLGEEREQGAVETASDIDTVVEESYKFVGTARAAVKLHNRGDAEEQGKRVEDLRARLEEVKNGLDEGRAA
ncbi:hypothetical protein AX16_001876 [Volvariella volvacea WC 439]|nr:hypothetical protein AX16_001876 [Volvariella volvacea WC 439]